ncbi:unnamed protein product, partial [Rotaria magnacalcarata]
TQPSHNLNGRARLTAQLRNPDDVSDKRSSIAKQGFCTGYMGSPVF